jgi:hypothetical protein
MLPLAHRRCLVRNPQDGAAAELSSGEYEILSACDGCSTLSEHELCAARRLSAPAARRPVIRELLERCAREGLFLPLPQLVARFGAAGEPEIAPIADISIPTANRPKFVSRLLAGASALQCRTGVAYRWHVFDDSRLEEHRHANRDAIASFPELDVAYHDLSAADSLETRLAAAFPELREEIASLLAVADAGEQSPGRPLNHMLLYFAGRRFLSMDDDALVDVRRPPLVRPGVDVGFSEKVAFWYESFDAAFAACPELPLDPFAEHAQWLGLPMAAAWALAEREPGGVRAGDLVNLAEPHFDPAAQVILTWNHVLGDPGWQNFSGEMLAISAETRAWLEVNPDAARLALDSQIRWQGRPSLHLAPQSSLTTTTLSGFDNRVLLPPSARTGRETDTLLGEMIRCIHPTAWSMSLPFALPHVRESSRQWLSPSGIVLFGANRLLIEYARLRSGSIRARDPVTRLTSLGAIFIDLAAAGDATLRGLMEEHAADRASKLAFRVNEQLDDPATPAAWKHVLKKWVGSPMLQLDAESLVQHTVSLEEWRALARRYGRALIAWPELWSYCRGHFQ